MKALQAVKLRCVLFEPAAHLVCVCQSISLSVIYYSITLATLYPIYFLPLSSVSPFVSFCLFVRVFLLAFMCSTSENQLR